MKSGEKSEKTKKKKEKKDKTKAKKKEKSLLHGFGSSQPRTMGSPGKLSKKPSTAKASVIRVSKPRTAPLVHERPGPSGFVPGSASRLAPAPGLTEEKSEMDSKASESSPAAQRKALPVALRMHSRVVTAKPITISPGGTHPNKTEDAASSPSKPRLVPTPPHKAVIPHPSPFRCVLTPYSI